MQSQTCRATVITPAFNSGGTLAHAATSVLQQSLSAIELIIVDDASSDDTLAVARAIATGDQRVRVVELHTNLGKSHAMNVAMEMARGRWICVLDADDWYHPDRLAVLTDIGESRGVNLVADNQLFFDDGAGRVVGTAMPEGHGVQQLDKTAFARGCDPYSAFDYGMLKPVVRADFIIGTGLKYRESARLSEDFLFMVEFFAAGGTAALTHRPLYYWRQAFGSVSRRWTTTGAGAWRYDYRSAAQANADVLADMSGRDEPQLIGLLTDRAVALRRLAWLSAINRLRADGAVAHAAALALRHPSIWTEMSRRAMQAGLRRIGAHSRGRGTVDMTDDVANT